MLQVVRLGRLLGVFLFFVLFLGVFGHVRAGLGCCVLFWAVWGGGVLGCGVFGGVSVCVGGVLGGVFLCLGGFWGRFVSGVFLGCFWAGFWLVFRGVGGVLGYFGLRWAVLGVLGGFWVGWFGGVLGRFGGRSRGDELLGGVGGGFGGFWVWAASPLTTCFFLGGGGGRLGGPNHSKLSEVPRCPPTHSSATPLRALGIRAHHPFNQKPETLGIRSPHTWDQKPTAVESYIMELTSRTLESEMGTLAWQARDSGS